MKSLQLRHLIGAFAVSLVATVAGCGPASPATGTVVGTVTLDGKPIDQAMLRFQPEQGRDSIGVTDANGRYELRFTATQSGAIPGNHKVVITTNRAQSGGEGGVPLVEAREEMLPSKYHTESELTAKVEPGPNEIDFALTSE